MKRRRGPQIWSRLLMNKDLPRRTAQSAPRVEEEAEDADGATTRRGGGRPVEEATNEMTEQDSSNKPTAFPQLRFS